MADPSTEQLPDEIELPDEIPIPDEPPKAPAPPSMLGSALAGATQGVTLGFGDELSAGTGAVGATMNAALGLPEKDPEIAQAVAGKESLGDRYRALLDLYRGQNAAAKAANPWTYGVADVATGLALPVGKVAKAAAPLARGAKYARAIGTGAALSGAAALGNSEGDWKHQLADTMMGIGVGGATAGAGTALGELVQKISPWLRKKAGERAVKALGGERSKTKYMDNPDYGGVPGTSARAGQEALDQGVSLSNPERALEQGGDLATRAGRAMDATKSTIDAVGSGGAVDYGSFADTIGKKVISRLQKPEDPLSRETAEKVGSYMSDLTLGMLNKRRAAQGLPALDAATAAAQGINPAQALGRITMQEAHDIRRGIDNFTGRHGIPNAADSAVNDELVRVRNAMSDEMEGAASKLGLGQAWTNANRAYKLAANIKTLAKTGVDKKSNNALPLRTMGVAAGALPTAYLAATSGRPLSAIGALSAPVLTWLGEKYGPAAAAHTLNAASRQGPTIGRMAPKAALPFFLQDQEAPPPDEIPIEQHAEGGEVAPEEAKAPGVTPAAQSMDEEAKRDFLRSSTDPAYRAARGPYRPDVAPAVRPNR